MLRILSQPNFTCLLNAFCPSPQTGTMIVPGAFVGESSVQALVTDQNAMKLARSMLLLNQEIDAIGRRLSPLAADEEWGVEDFRKRGNRSTFWLLNRRLGDLMVDIRLQHAAIQRVVIKTSRRYGDEADDTAVVLRHNVSLACTPRNLGPTAKVVSDGYEISFSEPMMTGVLMSLGIDPYGLQSEKMANALYRYIADSGQYFPKELSASLRMESDDPVHIDLLVPRQRQSPLMPLVPKLQSLWDALISRKGA